MTRRALSAAIHAPAAAVLVAAALSAQPSTPGDAAPVELWPEDQRAFLQDGPGLLLDRDARTRLAALPAVERGAWIDAFLADPIPETPDNELLRGIERRRAMVRQEFLTWLDDRARLQFLHGPPDERRPIDCGQTFVPLEIWRYGDVAGGRELVLYQRETGRPWRMWLPLDSKQPLYQRDMAYFMQQYEEIRQQFRVRRFDVRACPHARAVDDATGIEALRGFRDGRPRDQELLAALAAPSDLAEWARRAAATPFSEPAGELPVAGLELQFPERVGQRIASRFLLTIPAGTDLGTVEENDREQLRLSIDGLLEQDGATFEEFRVRFKLAPPAEDLDLALAFVRALRPQREFLLRIRIRDEVTGREIWMNRGFRVPAAPQAVAEPVVPEQAIVAMGEELALTPIAGEDSLLLAPPDGDVVFGVWRADALVTGERIVRVVFRVDGEAQLTKTQRPFSAELRLAEFPREQVIRAEGYDNEGELVAADQVLLNEPRGAFAVRIVSPPADAAVSGAVLARAEVSVPDERRVETVEFRLNEESLAVLDAPPWQVEVEVPEGTETTYLTVVATLDDGAAKEEVRFLNAPELLEQVEVRLVELLTTVTDRTGRPVSGLGQADFEVFEDGRRQEIRKFEQVDDVPLSVGIAIDTSGSMVDSLVEAKKAAVGFLRGLIGPNDRAFTVAFARRPVLLVPPTDDVMAVEGSLDGLQSVGWTALHDAVVSSLYYFRAFKGQRALILLSDGDDSASYYAFRDALEYARRSGVVIYTVGLDVGTLKVGIRRKLAQLAEETGGRVFFIRQAADLTGVYREISEELRSQYLLTYSSDNPAADGAFRTVEVKLGDGKLTARTIRGYYP